MNNQLDEYLDRKTALDEFLEKLEKCSDSKSQSSFDFLKEDYGYQSYNPKKIKKIKSQLNILFNSFEPCFLGYSYYTIIKFSAGLPLKDKISPFVEGYFLLLRWRNFIDYNVNSYTDVIMKMLGICYENLKIPFIFKKGKYCIVRNKHTEKSLDFLAKRQKQEIGDSILIVPAQFGIYGKARNLLWSFRLLRIDHDEFALGLFEVLCMLITHPERLSRYNDLRIDTSDEVYDKEGFFLGTLSLYYSEGKIIIGIHSPSVESDFSQSGLATGFIF
ncbi:MAG TPA: hypothetical protein PLE40_00355 [Candidatus Pacearchaeota archaeon]|nr:hypothetical protein [Candidatus Pacearchaeota archaeon]